MAVTDYKTPATCASVDLGNEDWADFNNAKVSDNAYASSALPKLGGMSDWLRATNFDFSVISSGATIDGIEVKIEHKAGLASSVYDLNLYLRKTSGQVGSNKASASYWPTSDAEATYGGATDKWGTTWLDTDIKSSNFGMDIEAVNGNADNAVTAYVDCISIRIYYTEAVTFQPWAIIMQEIYGKEDKVFLRH